MILITSPTKMIGKMTVKKGKKKMMMMIVMME